MELKPVNKHIDDVTIEQIEDHKLITQEELNKDLENLFGYDASENRNNFFGNPFLYHFQFNITGHEFKLRFSYACSLLSISI